MLRDNNIEDNCIYEYELIPYYFNGEKHYGNKIRLPKVSVSKNKLNYDDWFEDLIYN